MTEKAFQDYYPDDFSHCYGCDRFNGQGLQLKSCWDGDETVCRYQPRPYHAGGFPGFGSANSRRNSQSVGNTRIFKAHAGEIPQPG